MAGSFFQTFFGKGRWKISVPVIVGFSVAHRFFPGEFDLVVREMWNGVFAPIFSLLLVCFLMWLVLGAAWNALTGKKKWF